MAKFGQFKYNGALYGHQAPFSKPAIGIVGTPSLTDGSHIYAIGLIIPGVISVYVDSNLNIQNTPFAITDTSNTILNANRDEAIQGATQLSTVAMGEVADPHTEVDMTIQGLVKITIPYAGSRFSRN